MITEAALLLTLSLWLLPKFMHSNLRRVPDLVTSCFVSRFSTCNRGTDQAASPTDPVFSSEARQLCSATRHLQQQAESKRCPTTFEPRIISEGKAGKWIFSISTYCSKSLPFFCVSFLAMDMFASTFTLRFQNPAVWLVNGTGHSLSQG